LGNNIIGKHWKEPVFPSRPRGWTFGMALGIAFIVIFLAIYALSELAMTQGRFIEVDSRILCAGAGLVLFLVSWTCKKDHEAILARHGIMSELKVNKAFTKLMRKSSKRFKKINKEVKQ